MFESILAKIKQHDSIVIFGHIHPDGDCYGSQVGLKEAIKTIYPNKKVYIAGSGLPAFYDFISPMDEVSEEIIKNSLCIIVDANDLSRMEDQRSRLAKDFCKIDHHIDDDTFLEGPQVVDDTSSSACELIYEFILENNIKITKTAAKALYLGILTDTARFQFCNNFSKTFDIVSKLISLGANPSETFQILNRKTESELKLLGYLYSNYKKTKQGTLYICFDKAKLNEFNMDALEVANKVGLLSSVEGISISIIFVERDDGRLTAEFRSNTIDVQSIAAKHGGGGHLHASGMTVKSYSLDFINEVLNECDDAIKKGCE